MNKAVPPPHLDSDFIHKALQVPPQGIARVTTYRAIATDSRTIGRDEVFLALKGDAFDGHAFIEQAVQRGASAVIGERGHALPSGVGYFPVDDTLVAYRQLAAHWRKGFSLPVIAVAGAVGKTTTKEMIAALLRGRWSHVLKTEASENGFVGIPKTLLRLEPSHRVAVIEIGIDDIGAMEQHLELVQPSTSVVTAIAEEHMEKLGTLKRVAAEEGKALIWVAARGGIVAINEDDPWLVSYSQSIGGRIVSYRLKAVPGAPVTLQGDFDPTRGTLRVSGMGWKAVELPVPLPGAHNAQNLLAAVAVAKGLELSEREIREGLATFVAPSGRSQLKTLTSGVRVLCDFYNASPLSMRAGMKLISDLRAAQGKTWACLGDMLELGAHELDLHQGLAEPLLQVGFDGVWLFGPRMKALEQKLRARGYGGYLGHFDAIEKLADALLEHLSPQDLLFIKGSRGMKMERVYSKVKEVFPDEVNFHKSPLPSS